MVSTGPSDLQLARLARRVIRHLAATKATLATAESCTGGWIGQCLTGVPGSSAVYLQGIISYANTAKQSLLGVPTMTLKRHGAVSEPVALAMARGALKTAGSSHAVSVTGIAGPAGGSREKPVGTVWVAVARKGPGRRIAATAQCHFFRGDREAVRRRAVAAALQGLLKA